VATATDVLAHELAAYARGRGLHVEREDYRSASRRFTIRRTVSATVVEPRCSILLRTSASQPLFASQEFLFHEAEIRSHIWACSAVTDARVVNRPGRHGFGGRSSASTAVLNRRAGTRTLSQEILLSHASALGTPAIAGDWRLDRRYPGFLPTNLTMSDSGPYHARRALPEGDTFTTCVIGSQVILLGDKSPTELDPLLERSGRIAETLELTFLTLRWLVPTNAGPELLNVNPYPSYKEIGTAWALVRDALLRELFDDPSYWP
jgi:hypothetical protein